MNLISGELRFEVGEKRIGFLLADFGSFLSFLAFDEPPSFGEPLFDLDCSVDFFLDGSLGGLGDFAGFDVLGVLLLDITGGGGGGDDGGSLLGDASFMGCASSAIRRFFVGTGEPGERLHSRESSDDVESLSESSSSNCDGSMYVLLAEKVTLRLVDDRFSERSGV